MRSCCRSGKPNTMTSRSSSRRLRRSLSRTGTDAESAKEALQTARADANRELTDARQAVRDAREQLEVSEGLHHSVQSQLSICKAEAAELREDLAAARSEPRLMLEDDAQRQLHECRESVKEKDFRIECLKTDLAMLDRVARTLHRVDDDGYPVFPTEHDRKVKEMNETSEKLRVARLEAELERHLSCIESWKEWYDDHDCSAECTVCANGQPDDQEEEEEEETRVVDEVVEPEPVDGTGQANFNNGSSGSWVPTVPTQRRSLTPRPRARPRDSTPGPGGGGGAGGGGPAGNGSGGDAPTPNRDTVVEEVVVGSKDAAGTQQEITMNPDGSTKTTQKVVEASIVKIPEWRGVGHMRRWLCELIEAVEFAGGRTDGLEREWILKVRDANSKLEDFEEVWKGDPRYRDRFIRLARALYAGLKPFIKKHCPQADYKISRHQEKAIESRGEIASYNGMQTLWMLMDEFKMHGELNHGVRVEQIYTLKYPGDDKKEQFIQAWIFLVEDNDCRLPEATLRRVLHGKLKESADLEHDIKYFERLDKSHKDYSHDYLVKIVWDDINRKKESRFELEYNTQVGQMLGAPTLKGGVLASLQKTVDGAPAETDKSGQEEGREGKEGRRKGWLLRWWW